MFTESHLPDKEITKYSDSIANSYNVVSFFSGCGGLDLGFLGDFKFKDTYFERTKFNILAAYEFDKKCQITYEMNVKSPFFRVDLSTMNVAQMPAADVLIGGFPCQDFSICGPLKGVKGTRGGLFRSMSRYAKYWQPKIIVAENVPNLPRMNNGADLKTIQRSFSRAGYRMLLWPMYAPDYGIPQARSRIILVFVRKDISTDPLPPKQNHKNNHKSVSWAISDLLNYEHSEISNQNQYFKAAIAKNGNGQGDEISPEHAPGYTVRANSRSRVQFHYSLNRRLTVRESARLQTFPDSFVFPHDATSNMKQIGNAVPPVLGHALAASVVEFLNNL